MAQNNFQISSAAVSDKGLSDKRPNNEDSYIELKDSGLFAVADGVGGAQAGDVASQMAMEILAEAFINLEKGGDAEERMKAAIRQANTAICQLSDNLSQLSTMATTVAALHTNGNIATIGHVGDSRIYRLDSNNDLLRETQDHSMVEEAVTAGRMTPDQAAVHPNRNIISRALGADDNVEIDMKTIMFEPDTTFLVCTDGITRHISDIELKQILESENDALSICQQLKTLCYKRGAEDNLTAVVVKVSSKMLETGVDEKPLDIDFEEETVAAKRPSLVNSSVLSSAASVDKDSEVPFQEQEKISVKDLESDLISFQAKIDNDEPISKNEKESSAVNLESYAKTVDNADGIAGKLISGLVWFLIGGLIGAGITYFWLNDQKTETVNDIPEPRTEEPFVSSFEQRRKNVDENPAQFIAANISPQSAEDFYLIGRAYLRQGNYADARIAFENAKEKLNEINNENDENLAFEIAQGLSIVNDPFAQKTFEKELGISKSVDSNTQVNNSDTNSANQTQGEP